MSEPMLDKLRAVLDRHPEVAFAVLFGSYAQGSTHPKSDVDVAIRLREQMSGWALGGLAAEIENATGLAVDIVLLENIRSSLLQHEISKGKLVKGSPDEWKEFRVGAFREWREWAPRYRRMTAARLRRGLAPR